MKDCKCFRCGNLFEIDDNFKGSDIGLVPIDKMDTEEDTIVTLMSCPHCGLKYEVYDIPESEQEDYPYFREKSQ